MKIITCNIATARFTEMDFIETLKKELTNSGTTVIEKGVSGSPSVLLASKDMVGEKCLMNQAGRCISIIAVPASSTTADRAGRQSKEVLKEMDDNLSCIIIPEDRWRKSKEVTKARLLAHLGIFRSIYARDCEVRKISRSEADCFLERNHSYGGAKCKYCYGIFLRRVRPKDSPENYPFAALQSGMMIAAAEFSNARRWNKDGKIIRSYEWIRYASLPEMHISGGMGKVLKQFIKDVQPDDIMSYADLEWSDGEAYRQLGFSRDGYKNPVTFIIDTEKWTRTPILRFASMQSLENKCDNHENIRYFQNIGSIKYRLKLTDYNG